MATRPTKSQLYNYVKHLHNTRVDKIRERFSHNLYPLGNELLELLREPLIALDKAREEIRKIEQHLPLLSAVSDNNHGISNLHRSNLSFSSSPSTYVYNAVDRLARNGRKLGELKNYSSDPRIIEISEEWEKIVTTIDAEIATSNSLKQDLQSIIYREKTGSAAYKRLVDLGLDMTEFHRQIEEENKKKNNVPEITKTHINIAIFNNKE